MAAKTYNSSSAKTLPTATAAHLTPCMTPGTSSAITNLNDPTTMRE
jgi:hypothetical protein